MDLDLEPEDGWVEKQDLSGNGSEPVLVDSNQVTEVPKIQD